MIISRVSSNVHAHDDAFVSIYTGGFYVIAHKEKYFRTALLDSRKNTSGGLKKTKQNTFTLKLPFPEKQFLVAVKSLYFYAL